MSQYWLDHVALSDAHNRKRLLPFPENKVLAGENAMPAEGPSPQFFDPPRPNYILGWYYARRRVFLKMTDPSSYGDPILQ